MNALSCYLRSTIGKKFLVGVTGLGFAGFLVTHMAGNLLLFAGSDAYNTYSYKLISNPAIYVAEVGLVAMFVTHVLLVIQLVILNKQARPVSNVAAASGPKRTSFVAKTLILSGGVILAFTVLHLITFKYGTHYETEVGGVVMRDLYRLVAEKFQEPGYVGWYVFSVLLLMAHLSHGLSASLQSLGLLSANNKGARLIGRAVAFVIGAGFIAQPLYFYFLGAAS